MRKTPFVIATIVRVDGTSPDEAGTRLVVTKQGVQGKLNATNRDQLLIQRAREMLTSRQSWSSATYSLNKVAGASNGTCEVIFQYFDATHYPTWLKSGRRSLENSLPAVVVTILSVRHDLTEQSINFYNNSASPTGSNVINEVIGEMLSEASIPFAKHQLSNTTIALIEKIYEPENSIVVIGQSPVAIALINQLRLLPVAIQWLGDFARFTAQQCTQVKYTKLNDAEISLIRNGSFVAIATGDHSLDIRCCFKALQHPRLNFVGCLGSETKAKVVKKELAHLGLSCDQLGKLQMPVGLSSITGKHPSIIAASIIAQLLSLKGALAQHK